MRPLAGNITLDNGTAPANGRSLSADGTGSISLQAGGPGAVLDAPSDTINQQGAVDIGSALRLQGTLDINAGLAPGVGDSAITLCSAVDGKAGSPADRLELHSDGGAVRVLGAMGATLSLRAQGDATPVMLGATGAGLRLDGAALALLQGFGKVDIGRANGGALAIDADALSQLATRTLALAGSRIDLAGPANASTTASLAVTDRISLQTPGAITVAGRTTLATPGADWLLDSGDALTMAADAQLRTPGGDLTLRAVHDVAVGLLDARNGAAAAGAVVRVSKLGTLWDAAADEAVNVQAASVTLRGLGPVLAAGQSTSPAAIDIAAPLVDVDSRGGVVLRDTGTDGRTRFNLAAGDVLMQAAVVDGAPSRGASVPVAQAGASAADTAQAAAQASAWLAALRPLADLRGVPLATGALMLDRAADHAVGSSLASTADSAAVRYLAALGAATLQSAAGMAPAAAAHFDLWDDSLVL